MWGQIVLNAYQYTYILIRKMSVDILCIIVSTKIFIWSAERFWEKENFAKDYAHSVSSFDVSFLSLIQYLSALSNSIFRHNWVSANIPRMPPKISQNWWKLQLLHKFHQNVIQYLKNQTNFWQFCHSASIFDVIRCWCWVHIRSRFDTLKYRTALE